MARAMRSRDQNRETVAAAIAAHLVAKGLGQASLRQLAAAAGVSDRMLLYYFADKAEALGAATALIAGELSSRLESSLPAADPLPPARMAAAAARIVTTPEMRPYMRLWVEVVAAAARQEEPWPAIAAQIAQGFLGWIAAHLPPGDPAQRAGDAAMIFAQIDGLALLDICAGPELARAAVERIEAG